MHPDKCAHPKAGDAAAVLNQVCAFKLCCAQSYAVLCCAVLLCIPAWAWAWSPSRHRHLRIFMCGPQISLQAWDTLNNPPHQAAEQQPGKLFKHSQRVSLPAAGLGHAEQPHQEAGLRCLRCVPIRLLFSCNGCPASALPAARRSASAVILCTKVQYLAAHLLLFAAVDDINVDAPEGMTYAEWEASNVSASDLGVLVAAAGRQLLFCGCFATVGMPPVIK